jgi:hypothetical protein
MTFNIFLALCILGCDFLIYFLYQWIYGEKYRSRPRRRALQHTDTESRTSPLFLVTSNKNRAHGRVRSHTIEEPFPKKGSSGSGQLRFRGSYNEQLAYRRLTASFVEARARG